MVVLVCRECNACVLMDTIGVSSLDWTRVEIATHFHLEDRICFGEDLKLNNRRLGRRHGEACAVVQIAPADSAQSK